MPRRREPGGDPITEMARRLCLEHPDAPAKTLGRRLFEEANGAITLAAAYNRIRRQFGISGAFHRQQCKPVAARPPRQAGQVAAGMPQCTQEQIDQRFSICRACELFDGKACTKCGCPVVRERQFVSKLSWANEKCPVGKWGPVTG